MMPAWAPVRVPRSTAAAKLAPRQILFSDMLCDSPTLIPLTVQAACRKRRVNEFGANTRATGAICNRCRHLRALCGRENAHAFHCWLLRACGKMAERFYKSCLL